MAWDDNKSANDVILSADWNDMVADQKSRIHNSTFTAKGDIIVGTGSGTFTIRSIGVDGQFLKADSSDATGVIWANIMDEDVYHNYLTGATYKTADAFFNLVNSASKLSGGGLVDNGDGTLKVEAGTGIIRNANDTTSPLYFFDWSEVSSLSLTNNSINYIYVDYNSGSPQVMASTSLPTDHQTKVLLGKVYREGTTLHIVQAGQYFNDYANRTFWKDIEINGQIQYVNGLKISETGTRHISITAGSVYAGLTKVEFSAIDTSGTDTFTLYYRDGSGGWTKATGETQVDNTYYDDGSGTLASLDTGYFSNRWVYMDIDGHLYVVMGQAEHEKLKDAISEEAPSDIPDIIQEAGFLVGKIIVKEGKTHFKKVYSAFIDVIEYSGVDEHNDLAGLQGGALNEYYHLDGDTYTTLTSLSGNADKYLKVKADESGIEWAEVAGGTADSINIETLTGDKTLTPGTDATYQWLNPNGANRIVYLSSSASNGDYFIIKNTNSTDSYYITLHDNVSASDICNIFASSIVKVMYDGSSWKIVDRNENVYAFSMGYNSRAESYGVAIGNSASGYQYGVGVGHSAIAYSGGVATGISTEADNYGVAVGYYAKATNHGVAIGSSAKAKYFGVSIGSAAGYNLSSAPSPNKNILIGYKAGYNLSGSDNNNILIGYDIEETSGTSNKLNIGNTLIGDLSTKNLIWQATVRYAEIVSDSSSSGNATIDWTTGNIHKITLTEDTTLSFTDPASPTYLTLIIEQDSTGGHSITFPSSVKWDSGTAPSFTTSANATDVVTLLFDGTNYLASASLNFS